MAGINSNLFMCLPYGGVKQILVFRFIPPTRKGYLTAMGTVIFGSLNQYCGWHTLIRWVYQKQHTTLDGITSNTSAADVLVT